MANMRRLASLLLALMLVMSMAITAFADTPAASAAITSGTYQDVKGSITVGKAHTGYDYSIYQLLRLDSFNTEDNAYIYTVKAEWETWIEDSAAGGKYLIVNADGTVEWNDSATAATAKAFVAEAIAYAKANDIAPLATKEAAEGVAVTFDNLELGYYLVDSTAGAWCSIDTVTPNTVIEEKNLIPQQDKKVKDHEGNWQESTTARVGRTMDFATKVTVYEGTHNFVYHDKMDATLDYVEGSVVVYYTPMSNKKVVDPANYTVDEDITAEECDRGCNFHVAFKDDFMKTITQATDLTICYQAVLTDAAVIAGEGNINYAKITFGDEGESEWDPAKVYTYKFGIVKTDISNHILDDAEFDLYYEATGGEKIALVEDKPAEDIVDGVNYYRPATDAEKNAEDFVSAKIIAGKACIWGVRSGVTMYLEETKAPDGYNMLTARFKINALTGNNLPTYDEDGKYISGGVEVENLAGAQLPQTGGIGTTLFYVIGALMATTAGVLLVTKKRMGEEA